MPEDAIQYMAYMAKEFPVGLVSRDRLENSYNDEEDNGTIATQFTDTPPVMPHLNPDTHIPDTNNQNLDHTTNSVDSLNNTGNMDPGKHYCRDHGSAE